MDVLLLNADYRPVQVVPWERAVGLLLADKVHQVESYAGRFIRSERLEIAWPCVVSLVRYARTQVRPRLERGSLFARDGYTCAYCGVTPLNREGRPDRSRLTVDHVVPRSRASRGRVVLPWSGATVPVSSWENLVTACGPCNHDKADRTPDEAGLILDPVPRRPTGADLLRMALSRADVPDVWREYL